jgi:innexin
MRALFTFDYDNWYTSNSIVFPKLAKCEYNDYGPSGSLQKKDFICVLSVNILNEKLFAFLWLYLIVLASVSAINFTFRIFTVLSYPVRQWMILRLARPFEKNKLRKAMIKCKSFSEWFMLYQLGNNLNPKIFKELLRELDLTENISNEDDEDDSTLVHQKNSLA